jgi:hypothetical protein
MFGAGSPERKARRHQHQIFDFKPRTFMNSDALEDTLLNIFTFDRVATIMAPGDNCILVPTAHG